MGFFDFLKKKEINKIADLINQLKDLRKQIAKKDSLIESLEYLKKYEKVSDADSEAKRILDKANQKAQIVITEAEKQATAKRNEAIEILKIANKRKLQIKDNYQTIIDNAKLKAKELNQQADKKVNEATIQAGIIINKAEQQAERISGDAYRALKQADTIEQTIKALKNKAKGYGNEYIIPTYSLLDHLADDFGYTKAGQELKRARERSRLLIKNGLVAQCKYVEEYRRKIAVNFVADAFNGKVDTIFISIKNDNFGILKQKVIDAFHLVNNNGQAFREATITKQYLEAKLDELKWAVITTELRHKEREEQRRIKEQIREKQRAKIEYERALKLAKKEEELTKKAIQNAYQQLKTATEAQREKYENQLSELTKKLKTAEEKGKRALSMAQQTKSGHVYIISNIGSFGESVYKIGMTRRLEPTDRIKELGDASVPFPFDIHAIIYSEDAPALENMLHKYFISHQLNKVNHRKEFFRVNIAEIKEKIAELDLNIKWTILAEATQYRETLVIENQMQNYKKIKQEWEYSQLKRLN